MVYTISDLEQLSGVSVHNIRVWERRYKALTPLRSAGNTRSYSDEQLKRLLGITMLYHAGQKVSRVCGLSQEELNQELQVVAERQLSGAETEYFVADLVRLT